MNKSILDHLKNRHQKSCALFNNGIEGYRWCKV